jgi:HlyD family secretion protein
MFGRPLYRKEALDRLASPEELDCLFTVVRLPRWLVLVGVAALGVAALAFGVVGR